MIKKLLFKLIVLVVLSTTTTGELVAQNSAAYQAQYTNPAILRILRLDKTVRDKGAIVGTLTAQDLTRLPIGIMDPSGKVLICVDSAKFTPNGATFSAYAAVQLPGMKEKMCFKATNIPMGPNGITSANAPALTLVSTHVLQMGQKVDLVIPGTGGNNISWDCNGFKEINIEGKFVFKDGFFQVDKVEAPNDSTVTATVQFQHITNINNMMATVSITPFKIRGMEDFAFKVSDATVDMSDHANPNNFQFPAIYQNEFGANMNLWRGFFLRNLTVRLPFNKTGGYASVSATNMLIDENGVSGMVAGNNIMDINNGTANGWDFSVDTLRVEVLRNKLTGGALVGGMRIPFLGNDSLGYKASVSQWNDETQYLFQLGLREDKVFYTPLSTSVTLGSGSYVQIEKYGDTLEPTAFLRGKMGTADTSAAKFQGLKFENIALSTHAPYVHSGTFSLTDSISSPSIAGFNVSLTNVAFTVANGRASLGFKAGLNFMNDSSQGFGVQAGFIFKAKFENQLNPIQRLKWVYDGMDLSSVAINVNAGSFMLNGQLDIYRNDAVFGNGFHGGVTLKILPGRMDLNASAQAYFGNKDGLKYFQVSAYVGSNNLSVPIVPSVLYLNGFLGGISWHMKKQNEALVSLPVMLDTTKARIAGSDATAWARQIYKPNAASGLGIMVGVSFKTQSDKLLTGSVALEVGLNNNWGLDFVELKGMVAMFKDINTIDPEKIVDKDISSAAAFRGEILMLYDVPNKTFHANIAAYLNLNNKVVGAGPQDKIGELVIHADPSKWYIYVGRPSSPLGLKVTSLATVQAYFMVGSQLEPFPTPPNQILQNISYTPMISAQNLQTGGGVAFGARFNSSFGFGMDSASKSWVYGGFSVGAGADVMLSTSGNYTCGGEAAGFDGWWARGQAYVYIQGAVGIRVKISKNKSRKFDIANLSAGLLLEAKIPKPSWFRGFGYFNYSVLGGLIKGKANFKVQLGQECQMVSNPSNDRELEVKALSGIYPNNGATNMELYAVQAITTNIPINTGFQQMDDDGNVKNFSCVLEALKLTKNGVQVPGQVIFENGNKKIYFKSSKMLEPGTSYQVFAKLSYQKQLTPGGTWTTLQNDDGSLAIEDTTFSFVTGPPASTIMMHNIDYAYPFSDMQNFYKNEYAQGGYMKIDQSVNLDQVFLSGGDTTIGGINYQYKVKIKGVSPGSTETYMQDFTRNDRLLTFAIPTALQNEKVYRLSLVRITNGGNNNVQANNTLSNQINNADSTQDVYYADTIVSNVLNGPVTQNESEMFSYHFRVSKFNTFADKVASMSVTSENIQDMAVGNVLLIGARKSINGEVFDDFELKPLSGNGLTVDDEPIVAIGNSNYVNNFPMIKVRADSTNSWMQQDILPKVYPNMNYGESSFYVDTVTKSARGLDAMVGAQNCSGLQGIYSAIVPLDKISLEQIITKQPLSDPYERLSQVGGANVIGAKLVIKYNIPYYANMDYREMYFAGLCNWVRANASAKTPAYTGIVESGGVFPQIKSGTYKINLKYTLPGNVHNSTSSLEIQY